VDIDNLSEETYNAVIREVEKFHHNLTLLFSFSFIRDENEYQVM